MSRKPRRRPVAKTGRSRIFLGAAAAALFASGIYLGFDFGKPPPPPDFASLQGEPATSRIAEPATAKRAPEPVAETPLELRRQPPPGTDGRTRVAIVFDDLGRDPGDLDRLERLGVPLTYAVLPYETRTAEVVAELRRRGSEYLCHLPMAARGGADPGPGALHAEMSQGDLARATREALAAVPGAVGVNNHMGSGVAPDRQAMSAVLAVVAEKGLYFLDSRTSADTVGYTLARHLGVPAGERQVFLDSERDPAAIRGQFERLLELAAERGGAIAIAHPYAETVAVLAAELPAARRRGVEFVTASALLEG